MSYSDFEVYEGIRTEFKLLVSQRINQGGATVLEILDEAAKKALHKRRKLKEEALSRIPYREE